MEVNLIEKTSTETVAKNEDSEDTGTETKGSTETLVSSDKAETSATLNKNVA